MSTEVSGLEELIELGLTRYEALVYLALIRRDRFAASEAAKAAGVPRQRIYDVLDSLTRRGLVRTRPGEGQTVRYSAIDPRLAVERLLTAHRAQLAGLEDRTADLAATLAPVWSTGLTEIDPLDYVEVLRDPLAVAERFKGLEAGAEHQMLTLSKLPYAASGNKAGLVTSRRLRASGGDVRAIYERGVLNLPPYLADVREFIEAGEEARILETVPMKLCVVDGAHVLMALQDPIAGGMTSTSLMIEHPALAGCLIDAFDALWARAEDFATVAAEAAEAAAAAGAAGVADR